MSHLSCIVRVVLIRIRVCVCVCVCVCTYICVYVRIYYSMNLWWRDMWSIDKVRSALRAVLSHCVHIFFDVTKITQICLVIDCFFSGIHLSM